MTRSEPTHGLDLVPGGRDLSVQLEGLHCASCASRVERAVRALPGVVRADVNLAGARLSVTSEAIDAAALVGAVENAGYRVVSTERELALEGLHCASCVARVERALRQEPGVVAAEVNLASGRARVVALDEQADLVGAVARAGYRAVLLAPDHPTPARTDERRNEAHRLGRDAVIAAVLSLPIVLVEMGGHLVPAVHAWVMRQVGLAPLHWIELALTAIVLLGPGRRFFTTGLASLWRLSPEMNALVALGAGAAALFSAAATLAPASVGSDVYFESAVVIVTLILAGRFLEARARGRTGAAIERLAALQPAIAHRVVAGGALSDVPLAGIRLGDRLLVKPGERVPLDGTIEEGASHIDESMLTGEAEPVAKGVGQPVTGGAVNGAGSFTFRVTAIGGDTTLARIIAMVERAQGAKLPVQALADRVTAWFVPAVIALAALTLVAWLLVGASLGFALSAAVAVLVISCPCAMGLATPVSIMVAMGRAAELGILFRQGQALQTLAGVTGVVFDKTGTLTLGRPTLVACEMQPGFSRDEVLAYAAALETRSEHPLARAIIAAAGSASIEDVVAETVTAEPGRGLRGRVAGRTVLIGSARFMRESGVVDADQSATAGAVFVAVDGRLAAALRIADAAKPDAAATVAALRARDLSCAMVTGDAQANADLLAREVGIERVVADVLPPEKVAALESLGRASLAFVGDGINDAPALAASAVGIAIGSGTDVAIEAADVVLTGDRLGAVAQAIDLSRATMRNIRQNLFWAFAYNIVLIPVAAGALYPTFGLLLSPMLAAGAMGLSSVFVVTNALRLRRFGV